MPLRGAGAGRDTISGRRCPSRRSPLAGEHNPDRSHLYPNLTVHPRSTHGECTAFSWSCFATPADHGASAETCVKSHQRWNFTVSSGASETAIEARIGPRAGDKEALSDFQTYLSIAEWITDYVCKRAGGTVRPVFCIMRIRIPVGVDYSIFPGEKQGKRKNPAGHSSGKSGEMRGAGISRRA